MKPTIPRRTTLGLPALALATAAPATAATTASGFLDVSRLGAKADGATDDDAGFALDDYRLSALIMGIVESVPFRMRRSGA